MEIRYRANAPITAEQFVEVWRSAGLRRPVNDLPRIQHMLDNANLMLTSWAGDQLIGFARSLTDYVFCCYLSDLAVRQGYQRSGIGKELIRRTQETIGEESMLLLLAAPEAMSYYPHIGFDRVDCGWIINRKR
jgi:GNAT superfamily N-acetyltransferase